MAAIGALAANKQGKFWEFHRKLFENQKALDDAKMQEIAGEIGLDMGQFNTDTKDPTLQKLVFRDVQEGQQAGVRGIPTIFVNGRLLRKRNKTPESLAEMIEIELKKMK